MLLDLVGLLLFAVAIGWVYVSASLSGGSPAPVAGLLLACAGAFLAGQGVAMKRRALIPAALVVVAGWLVWQFREDLPGRGPLTGPLGYANSSAALYLQMTVAALVLAAASRRREVRVLAFTAALVLVIVTILTDSQAANLLLMVPFAALPLSRAGFTRLLTVALAGLLMFMLAFTIALGATYRGAGASGLVNRTVAGGLSERRPALWHDALAMMRERPVMGVGPGRFPVVSPIARSDADARWAHNGFLQQGAEEGVPGLALLVGLFLWGFARLWANPRPDTVTALGAAAIAALGLHACIDYILHFPAVPIVASALLGVASTPGPASIEDAVETS